jgi:hypothetical protein
VAHLKRNHTNLFNSLVWAVLFLVRYVWPRRKAGFFVLRRPSKPGFMD